MQRSVSKNQTVGFAHGQQLLIAIVGYLSYAAVYCGRVNLSILAAPLEKSGILTKSAYGTMGSAFFIMYSIGQLLNGMLGDRWKPKKMIVTGLFLTGIVNLLMAITLTRSYPILIWGANGFAQSMIWAPLLRMVSERFGKRKQLVGSLLISSVGFGSVVGILLAALLVSGEYLRLAFAVPGGICLLMAIVCTVTLKKEPARIKVSEDITADCENTKLKRALSTGKTCILEMVTLIRMPDVAVMLLPAMIHGVLKDNITNWVPLYFIDTFHTGIKMTAFFVMFIPLIGLIARFLYPLVYSLSRQNEKRVCVASFVLCVIALIFLIEIRSPVVTVVCLAIVYGAISLINTSLLSIYAMRFQKIGNVSSVAGLMDFVTYMGAGISSVIYGVTMEAHGYYFMFVSWIILSVVAIILLLRGMKRRNIVTKIMNERGKRNV